MVSHDRYLMERVTDDQFALIDGTLRHVPGGVDEYLHLLDAGQQNRNEAKGPSASTMDKAATAQESPSEPALSNSERRELRKRFDSVARKLQKRKDEPERIKKEMAAADPSDYEKLMSLQEELAQTEQEISDLEDEWLELSDTLGIE